MAKAPKKNYGTRKRVACVANKETDFTNIDTAFGVPKDIQPQLRRTNGYLLISDIDSDKFAPGGVHNGVSVESRSKSAKKCCCAECMTVFDTDIDLVPQQNEDTLTAVINNSYDANFWSTIGGNGFNPSRRELLLDGESVRQAQDVYDNLVYGTGIQALTSSGQPADEPECPNCHQKIKTFIPIMPYHKAGQKSLFTPTNEDTNNTTLPLEGNYVIPPRFVARQIFESRDDDQKLTKVEDSTLFRAAVISADGTDKSVFGVEISDTMDLLEHTRSSKKSIVRNGRREMTISDKPTTDPYRYTNESRQDPYAMRYLATTPTSYKKSSVDARYFGIDAALDNSFFSVNTDGHILKHQSKAQNEYNGLTYLAVNGTEVITEYNSNQEPEIKGFKGDMFLDVKTKLLEQHFRDAESTQDPVMTDSSVTGLYITEHKKDSNETNTATNAAFKDRMVSLMTRYPAAYEYALERAHNHVIDYEMSQKRKAKTAEENGEHYDAKTMTDKGKAKFMRQEVIYVAEQLATMDNKLLKIVQDSPNASAMKTNLAYVAFGNQASGVKSIQGREREFIEGGRIRIDTDNAQSASVKSKALINKFNNDVLGVTNTIYTAHKIGIHNIDHINELIAIGQSSTAETISDVPQKDPPSRRMLNAGTIKPIETQRELQFLRTFGKSHAPSDIIEIYRDPKKYDLYHECVRMFAEMKDKDVVLVTESDAATGKYARQMQKNNLTSYLQHHTVEEAYVDYVTNYGAETPTRINELIAEIKLDNQMPEIQKCLQEQGIAAAVEMAKPYFKGTSKQLQGDMEGYITTFDQKDEYADKQLVATRNGKDLFKGRSLNDIHDELSHINRHLVSENCPLTFPPELQAMEKTYPNPDGEGEWSFHCHKDSFDVIKSSTHLHNCLGSSYVTSMQCDQSYVMYMQDETGLRVAAIELARNGKKVEDTDTPQWTVKQFQADHDTALPARYADVAMQWLNECSIDYEHSGNVKKFGSNEAFYGDGTGDFHHEEIDDTNNTVVQKSTLERRRQEREEMAKRLFNFDENTGKYDFGVEVPEW